ncbi:hypothetical protein E2C01_026995 [Portunus trituberculatus]|uniref:Uncharacterized protein n=1 Tax=Portunus trituberculatus TaxID=210409 RepID=A0A5B7EGS7_PORTR|nr:hypothetical protein [Portunus trituberculatus]
MLISVMSCILIFARVEVQARPMRGLRQREEGEWGPMSRGTEGEGWRAGLPTSRRGAGQGGLCGIRWEV